MVKTNLNPPVEYDHRAVVRIVNPKQYKFYIKNKVYPIDIYASIDDKGGDIIVMVFDRQESYPLYQKWCDYETEQ